MRDGRMPSETDQIVAASKKTNALHEGCSGTLNQAFTSKKEVRARSSAILMIGSSRETCRGEKSMLM